MRDSKLGKLAPDERLTTVEDLFAHHRDEIKAMHQFGAVRRKRGHYSVGRVDSRGRVCSVWCDVNTREPARELVKLMNQEAARRMEAIR